MGAWDNLRPASFRGVPFEVDGHDESGGRRLARHEYPLRDVSYAEDLGRKAGEWRIEAFLVQRKGVNVASVRDKLREALKAAGPGTLVHPYLGEMSVCVDDFRLRESTREGGYCSFSITFVESGANTSPFATANTAAATQAQVKKVKKAAEKTWLEEMAEAAKDMLRETKSLPGGLHGAADFLGLPVGWATDAHSTLGGLLDQPDVFSGRLLDLFDGVGSLFASPSPRGGTSRTSTADLERIMPVATPAVAASDAAPSSVVTLVGTTAVAEAANATSTTEYATADDALAARDDVIDAIDVVTLSGVSDEVYATLVDLRAAVAADLTTRGAQLPHLARVTLPQTMPALVAAYRVHGDASRDDEIVTRNAIRHPGKVPGGVPLEVLDA